LDPSLHRIHHRTSRLSPIRWRLVGGYRLFTVFFEHPTTRAITLIGISSALYRHQPRPIQMADLRPILHTQHPLPPNLD
jgi:hypothetical protein